jgi:signal peptidase II
MATVRPNALPWLALSALVLAADQASKAWVLRSLPEYTPVPVIEGFWNWYRTYNTGAAFSLLADAGGWQKWLFAGLALAISALMTWMLACTRRNDYRQALPLALIIGGALGNVIDRFVHGHVVDFIQWHLGQHYWPAFNVADSAVVAGAVGLALFGLLGKPGSESGPARD